MAKQKGQVKTGGDPADDQTDTPPPVAPPVEGSGGPPATPPSGDNAAQMAALKTELEGKLGTLETSILKRMPSLDGLRDDIAKALSFIDDNPLAPVGDVLGDLASGAGVKDAANSTSGWASSITLLGAPIAGLVKQWGSNGQT